MMRKLIISGIFLSFTLLCACGKKEFIKNEQRGALTFSFFLFLQSGDSDFRGSGDAMLLPGNIFKFRVYDNLLNKHLFDFTARSSGDLEITVPVQKIVYLKKDPDIGEILTIELPKLFSPAEMPPPGPSEMEGLWIKSMSTEYQSKHIRISVLKRSENNMPRRVSIEETLTPAIEAVDGQNKKIIFDITGWNQNDFIISGDGYARIEGESREDFFDWLGELHE